MQILSRPELQVKREASMLKPFNSGSDFRFRTAEVQHLSEEARNKRRHQPSLLARPHASTQSVGSRVNRREKLRLCRPVPNERVPICSKRQGGHSTEVAIQGSDTFAGIQVPDPDFVVHWGGEELQTGDIGVELNKAGEKEIHPNETGIQGLARPQH